MIAGERKSKNLASSYAKNPLHAYAEAFKRTAEGILNESGIDMYMDPGRVMMNRATNDAVKKFFVEDSVDPEELTPEELEDHEATMEAQYENNREAIMEHTTTTQMNPIIGLAFPLHKLILMNMVFDKGAIDKVVAQSSKFTISMERRILVDTEGNEIDMFKQQSEMTAAIDKTAPVVEFEILTLPLTEDTEIVHNELGGLAGVDHLGVETKISAVLVKNVYFEEGDILPDPTTGYVEMGGIRATASDVGPQDVWVRVNMPFAPSYSKFERTLMQPVDYTHKEMVGSNVEIVKTKDVISGTMHKDRLNIMALHNAVAGVRVSSKLDPSNARATTCSVTWKEDTDIVEIPNAIPINTTLSPEEVKDIAALYNVNQLTKVMHLMKTAMANYKDDKIKENLDESYMTLEETSRFHGKFDYAPREGYALDHVEWRKKTFFDYFDTYVTRMLQVLNDPNMVVTVFGDPDLIRKITPVEYTYQSPPSIGPVTLDFTKTVVTSDNRVYQFIGSDKLRWSDSLIIILNPRGTDRIIYRIYDYQLYISNEIRNADNPSLPSIHAFERWKFVEYQPVQGRLQILNPTGLREEGYDYVSVKQVP